VKLNAFWTYNNVDILSGGFGASVANLMKRIGWDPNSMWDMTFPARVAFIRKHRYPLQVPTICLVTEAIPSFSFLSSLHGTLVLLFIISQQRW